MKLRWTPEAADDLNNLSNYLLKHHPEWRDETMERIYRSAKQLRLHPGIGRPTLRAEFRELPLPPLPYVIHYHADAFAVTILQIRHGAQMLA